MRILQALVHRVVDIKNKVPDKVQGCPNSEQQVLIDMAKMDSKRIAHGYVPDENLSNEALIRENYQGIRPAPGYAACPEHTEKATIWQLLNVEERIGMKLTDSFAMWPGASVSGWYFSHPGSKYFAVAQIQKDQIEDYASRKGMRVSETERWLSPNLGYDAD